MFAERLAKTRKAHGLTQKQVANGIGITPVGYQQYELGRREPNFQRTIALADFFNVSADYLFGRTDNPEINH